MSSEHRIGVDIGGTFTDFTLLTESGQVHLWKEESTPADPLAAVVAGLAALAERLGQSPQELLGATRLLVHGTTIATNMLIQRNGPVTALLCTEGFRDVLHYRDGFKPARFDIHLPHPEPLVPRWLRLPIGERTCRDGEIARPLDESTVVAACERIRRAGVESVAVALLWSIANPAHERRVAEIVRRELPDVDVVCSCDILAELREWERTSATVLSAYIRPKVADYLRRLERSLADGGLPTPPLVMQVNGGCGRVADVLRGPVSILASGPTAAPATAVHAGRVIDAQHLITMDIGGTSCDVCIISDGRPAVSRELRVDEQPLGVQGVEIHSIGAGGGSIGWVDDGGALRIGPASAGAVPGPACYAQGGARPTVTDANLVLGALSADAFLGGRRRLRVDLAEAALARDVAEPLGLSVAEAAAGMRRVVEQHMVSAIRTLSTERGIDPRGFVLVVGGGAGPLHGAEVARALGIGKVLVPGAAGTLCAFGMTVTDVRHDHAATLHAISDDLDPAHVARLFDRLERQALERMAADGFDAGDVRLERWVDARYVGQVHELTVRVPAGEIGQAFAGEVADSFHEEHRRLYTYARPELPVELLHWRVQTTGHTQLPEIARAPSGGIATAEPRGVRDIAFAEEGVVGVPVYEADQQRPGLSLTGPAVIDGPTTTVLVGPRDRLTVLEDGGLLFDVAPRRPATGRPEAVPAGV